MVQHMNRETFEIPDEVAAHGMATRNTYIDALRDWVRRGSASPYALPTAEVKRRMQGPSEADVRAATHVRLGRHLYTKGELEAAKHHFREAVRLCPQKWNYRRQSNMLDPQSVGELNAGPDFFDTVDTLMREGVPFYPPANFSMAS